VAVLLGHDLDHRPGAAALSRPGALLEPAHDHSAASAYDESRLMRTAEATRIGQRSECICGHKE
jgi:hypothetical protein